MSLEGGRTTPNLRPLVGVGGSDHPADINIGHWRMEIGFLTNGLTLFGTRDSAAVCIPVGERMTHNAVGIGDLVSEDLLCPLGLDPGKQWPLLALRNAA